jgi:hypothetical protein
MRFRIAGRSISSFQPSPKSISKKRPSICRECVPTTTFPRSRSRVSIKVALRCPVSMCKRSTRGRSASTMLENPSNLPDVTPSRRCSSIAWKKAPAPKPSPTDPEQGIARCPMTRQQPRDGVNRPGFAGSMDLKTTLGNIYPDHPHFHVDLLASGLWPIDPEPGSRGASITSYRCNDVTTCPVDPNVGLQCDHRRASAARTRRNAPLSTCASTRTLTPSGRVISITPSGWFIAPDVGTTYGEVDVGAGPLGEVVSSTGANLTTGCVVTWKDPSVRCRRYV